MAAVHDDPDDLGLEVTNLHDWKACPHANGMNNRRDDLNQRHFGLQNSPPSTRQAWWTLLVTVAEHGRAGHAAHDTFHEVTARRINCIGSRCIGRVLGPAPPCEADWSLSGPTVTSPRAPPPPAPAASERARVLGSVLPPPAHQPPPYISTASARQLRAASMYSRHWMTSLEALVPREGTSRSDDTSRIPHLRCLIGVTLSLFAFERT